MTAHSCPRCNDHAVRLHRLVVEARRAERAGRIPDVSQAADLRRVMRECAAVGHLRAVEVTA